MCHTETMECTLQVDSLSSNRSSPDDEALGSFGFTLQNGSYASDLLLQPPIIGYLAPGGVAERYEKISQICIKVYFPSI